MHAYARLPREVTTLNLFFKNWQTITIINLQGNDGSRNKLCLAPPWAAVRSKLLVWVRKCSIPTNPFVAYGDNSALQVQEIWKGERFQKTIISFSPSHQTSVATFMVQAHEQLNQCMCMVWNLQKEMCPWRADSPHRHHQSDHFHLLSPPFCPLEHGIIRTPPLRGHRPTERGQRQPAEAEWEPPKIVLMK